MSIHVRNIYKKLDRFEIRNVSFSVSKGEYYVLLGPSGSGKTVILEMVAGLLRPDAGEISSPPSRGVGFIYQDYMLFPHLTVFRNIGFGLKAADKKPDVIDSEVKRISCLLEVSHLLDRKIDGLSGGEKQRVAIARAMAISPDIYLFDEPTAALDKNLRIRTRRLFRQLHKETDATFIHVTHDFEEALALADKIGILMNGELVQEGKPDEVFGSPGSKEVADFLGFQNVYGGPIRKNRIEIGGIKIMVPRQESGFSYIAIRNDEILLSRKTFDSSARNVFCGKVTDIHTKSSVVEIVLDIGVPLSVDITRQSFKEMRIKVGDDLWSTFKVSSIKVFEH